MTTPILVTGASGFIAKHVIAELIRNGHAVRGTVRNPRRANAVHAALGGAGVDPGRLELVPADLMNDDGWPEAAKDCRIVLHVASPFPLAPPRDHDSLIRPARDGTLRVLRAATAAGVERVVVTSSIAACIYPSGGPQARTYTEADWTDPKRPDISSYIASKTIAERAAWDYVRTTPGAPQLVALNPGFVQGPALDPDVSSSHELILQMARGMHLAVPKAGFAMVDVRDVAAAHVVAATHPSAAGERFLLASGYLTLLEIGRVVAHALPDLAPRMPRFELPDLLVQGAAWGLSAARAVLPDLSTRRLCDNAKARSILGIGFRPPREAVAAAASSLRQLGVL